MNRAPEPADYERVERLRQRSLDGVRKSAEAFWLVWTGGLRLDPPELEELRAEDVVSLLKVTDAQGDPALFALERLVLGEWLARPFQRSDFAAKVAGSSLEGGGPLTGLQMRLAGESDRQRRLELQASARPALQALVADRQALDEALDEAARAVGFDDPRVLAARSRGFEVDELRRIASSLLQQSEGLYREAMGEAAQRELGLSLSELRRADVPRLFVGAGFSVHFPRDGARQAAEATFEGLGLGLKGVQIDDVAREGKFDHPLAIAPNAPTDVRLSLPAQTSDWGALLGESAAAAQAVRFDPALPAELRMGLDASASEAFAQLFRRLEADPAWLRLHGEMTAAEAATHAAGASLRELEIARRLAGRLKFELSDSRDAAAYRQAMEEASGFALDEADAAFFVLERDAALSYADGLMALLLSGMVEEWLVEHFGETWWSDADAGAALASLFSRGNLSPAELVEALGREELDPGALLRRLSLRLDRSEAPQPAENTPR